MISAINDALLYCRVFLRDELHPLMLLLARLNCVADCILCDKTLWFDPIDGVQLPIFYEGSIDV